MKKLRVDREYMRKVINDALKLRKQESAYGINFYSAPQNLSSNLTFAKNLLSY